jgi:predicted Holliday junction resolvase-like endonuclease
VAQQRQALKSQIADTVNQLQAATTDAETQKLQGVLTAQSAQLAALGDDETNAATQAVVQDIANRNDQQKQQEAQDEEVAADRQDALTKFGTMMVPDTNNNLRFGAGQ